MHPSDDLNYEVSGDRLSLAVLFLHGFMGSSADWREVMAGLEDRTFRIAVDLPGHGASLELAPDTYTVEGAARAVIGILDGLEVIRPLVAGYSMGGRLALYLALHYPERCAGLFLESASPGLQNSSKRAARRAADESKAKRLESGDLEAFLRDWYRQPLFASLARDGDLLRRTIEARRRNDPGELARSLRGMGTGSQPSLWGELEGLGVPALAVAGGLDGKYAGISSRMAGINPRIGSAVIDGAGHAVHAEAPAEYVALLGRFVGRLTLALGEAKPVP
ncbi:2-succinyl-6-hydroxy-2,4-cyclohexadiene-1-carboxylate synthase [uncultured Rubrobacteraceae bacterium]|uniref:Putative 2-succinyl-6-hydroxy-2,4-cyclohexadiene-1-carboxylate synthase n=1 Tax=uncultured Rubrobacteraceae bacterium TaxID=349277 RepID=A0A6J4QBH5_9ACTN|nr:2-succinyl-6-hydroxy-2,4-cyclohexadiene-1-carboxylate synthase [uncultured Rubrobacteraceae bacterium]